MKSVALHNLGCKVNSYEREVMQQMLQEKGYRIVSFDEMADIYIVNTCTVTNIADRKSRQMLHRARAMNPDAVVVAVGCYVQTGGEQAALDESIDLAVGNNHKKDIVSILERFLEEREAGQSAKRQGDNKQAEKAQTVNKQSEKKQADNRQAEKAQEDNKQAEKMRADNKQTNQTQEDNTQVNKALWDKTLGGGTLTDMTYERRYEEMMLKSTADHTRAYIKIQDGCNQFCSYCIIPYARGRVRSRRAEDILEEIRGLAAAGYQEVVLTGIHISSYGIDFADEMWESGADGSANGTESRKDGADGSANGTESCKDGADDSANGTESCKDGADGSANGTESCKDGADGSVNGTESRKDGAGSGTAGTDSHVCRSGSGAADNDGSRRDYSGRSRLIDLTERIHEVEGIRRIRLGSLEPRIITQENARRLAALPKLCPHFHLSLQSGCGETLKRMNRRYTPGEYYQSVENLRRVFEHPAITTDVIVGFPGETEEEFEATRAFLEKVRFYEMHVFKYSKRQGTQAASMPCQIPEKTKAQRSGELLDLEREQSREFRSRYIGKEAEVLFEETKVINGRQYQLGYTADYVKIALETPENLSNCLIKIKVTEFLTDEILNSTSMH